MLGLLNYLFIDTQIWFLIALFAFDLVLFLCQKVKHKILLGCSIYILSFIGWMVFDDKFALVKNFAMFAPFFFGGFFFGENKEKFEKLCRCLPLVLLYPISMIFYTYKDSTKILLPIQNLLTGHMPVHRLNIILKIIDVIFITFYNHFIVAPLGIIFICAVVLWVTRKQILHIIQNIFVFLGNYTIEIYLMSNFFFVYLFSNGLNIIVSLILGCVMPIIISIIINEISPKLATVLFGSAHKFNNCNIYDE